MAVDRIAAAVKAAEEQEKQDAPASVSMQQFNVTIASSGRPALLALPVDVTDSELAELCGWMLVDLMRSKRAEREKGAASRILVPAGSGIARG